MRFIWQLQAGRLLGQRHQPDDRHEYFEAMRSPPLDALSLARMQFAVNITFHILFPTITIALGWVLLAFRLKWLRTQDGAWLAAYRFWTKVFALTFALGVVSGTTMSAFWILALNSWMQTPTCVELRGGEFFVTSWAEVIFNPSFPYRLAHILLASGLTVAFLLAGLSAWQILCRRVRHCRNGTPAAVQPTRRGFHSPSSVQLGRLLS